MPEPFDFDRFMEEAREGILDYGHVVHYSDDQSRVYRNLPRAWTTGRTMWQRPELMIVGPFTHEQMQEFLNEAVDLDSQTPIHPQAVIELAGRKFRALEAERSMFMIAMGIFGGIRGLQLVWLTEDGTPGDQPVFPPDTMPLPAQHDPYTEEDTP